MANYGEGKIEIPLEDFWGYVERYHDHESSELLYGVPSVNPDNETIEINYAFSTNSNPSDWAEKPECYNEWVKLRGRL